MFYSKNEAKIQNRKLLLKHWVLLVSESWGNFKRGSCGKAMIDIGKLGTF